MRELARIWYGKAEPYPLFKDDNFIKAFSDVFIQMLLNIYDPEDDAWNNVESVMEVLYGKGIEPIFYLTQAAKAREMLIQGIRRMQRRPFSYEKALRPILRLAHEIEMRLKTGQKPPYTPIRGVRELSCYENLPVLPID
jgi:hypothetical protein